MASRSLFLPLASLALGACSPSRTAEIRGQLAAESDGTPAEEQEVRAQRVNASEESSLAGLTVSLEVWRAPDEALGAGFEESLEREEVLGPVVPDAAGRFSFSGVPARPAEGLPVWPGRLFVRIDQDDASEVLYCLSPGSRPSSVSP